MNHLMMVFWHDVVLNRNNAGLARNLRLLVEDFVQWVTPH